ncbi:MAG: type II toxin-antitoxin system MqsA family antitoxin [Desulfobulbaceae bacterium]|nr:type II toxin-antitoxin system MqsA family antitoxin [Desulfobulbaceae bacterium]
MKCAICRNGHTIEGHITVVLERDQATLVFKNVPAMICENCGEEYLSADTNRLLLQKAQEAVDRGVDLELMRFAA